MDLEPEVIAHAVAGFVMVVSGGIAGVTRKGSTVHRWAGRLFVFGAALTAVFIVISAFLRPGSVPALGLIFTTFVSYLILTSLSVIKQRSPSVGVIEMCAPFVALAVAGFCFWFGAEAFNDPHGLKDEVPYGYYIFFGAMALLAAIFDIRLVLQHGVAGHQRLIRHLWRMLFALYFATASMFTGPGNVLFPEDFRSSFIITLPENFVGLLLLFWVGRMLLRSYQSRQ